MFLNLQILRGFAALSIVFVHFADLHFLGKTSALGRGGVDLFLVLSGFIIGQTTRHRQSTPARFLMHRLARIVPLYWSMTLVVFVIASIRPDMLGSTSSSVSDLLRSLLFIPHLKASGLMQPTLFVGWTLNYIVFFYAIFSLSMLPVARRFDLAVPIGVLAALVLAGCALKGQSPVFQFYTSTVLLEFVGGMILSRLIATSECYSRPLAGAFWMAALGALGLLALLVAPLLLDLPRAIVCGIPAFAVVLSATSLEGLGFRIKAAAALAVGDASYSIYLTHPFVLQAFHHLWGDRLSISAGGALTVLFTFGAVILVGWMCHHFVDRPLSARALTLLTGKRRVPVVSATPVGTTSYRTARDAI